MIVRVYRATVHPGMEVEFEAFLREQGMTNVTRVPGCRGAMAGRDRWSEEPVYFFVSMWDSIEALQGFTGPDWQQGVIVPDEAHLIASVSTSHFETLG